MDINKASKLREIGYKIEPSCGTCKHFVQRSDEDFGDCQIHDYEHLKHTGGRRRLSVVRYGQCKSFEANDNLGYLHGFKEFLDE